MCDPLHNLRSISGVGGNADTSNIGRAGQKNSECLREHQLRAKGGPPRYNETTSAKVCFAAALELLKCARGNVKHVSDESSMPCKEDLEYSAEGTAEVCGVFEEDLNSVFVDSHSLDEL